MFFMVAKSTARRFSMSPTLPAKIYVSQLFPAKIAALHREPFSPALFAGEKVPKADEGVEASPRQVDLAAPRYLFLINMPKRSSRLKTHAREMRRNPTRAEGRMWCWLRNRRFSGVKFRRQVPIGRYIVDFYCPQLKVAIELDGTHHRVAGMDEYDDRRTRDLRRRGIYVLRIPNELLIRDSLMVSEMISAVITGRAESQPPHPPSAPSPPLRSAGEKDSR
jgi:very-short-patch-repair endonuclease